MTVREQGRKLKLLGGALGVTAVVGLLVLVGATPVSAADTDIKITEVAPRASSTALADDWIELTNLGSTVVDLTDWRVDDNSNNFSNAGFVLGVTSIAPGESVVLVMEATEPAVDAFEAAWFGGVAPAGLQIGWVAGTGLGLGSGGDGVNVFNGAGTLVANVTFGSAGNASPSPSFDNSAGASGSISTFSQAGVGGAFVSSNGSELGSPGISPGAPPRVRVTEVAPRASSTALGKDWFELTNIGTSPVDITNWRADDSSFSSTVALSGVTLLAPGESAVFVTETTSSAVAAFTNNWFGGTAPAGLQIGWLNGSGLGLSNDGDQINVFNAGGALVANVSFGIAPSSSPFATFDNSAGADAATLATLSSVGVNNAFLASNGAEIGSPGTATVSGGGPTGPTFDPWPGSPAVQPIENFSFGEDMSGLDYEDATPDVLWAARNKAGTLFKLVFDGANWMPDTANDWGAGKDLHYPNGSGHPDSEGVTYVGDTSAGGIYIASERDNDFDTVSRNSILRYDVSAAGSTLTATQEWNLTADLPVTGANLGLEAVTWIDDSYLVSKGFFDESKGHAYAPAEYPNHGTGVFFVALEDTGDIYAYALETTGAITRLATIESDLPIVTDLQYDRDEHKLWAECDNTCHGRLTVLDVAQATGKFAITAHYERPTGLGDNNNEGFAIAPAGSCVSGLKPVYWADDNETGGVSIVEGSLPCNGGPTPVIPEFPMPALAVSSSGVLLGGWMLLRRRSALRHL